MFTKEELTVIVQALKAWTEMPLIGPHPMTEVAAWQRANNLARAISTFMKEEMK